MHTRTNRRRRARAARTWPFLVAGAVAPAGAADVALAAPRGTWRSPGDTTVSAQARQSPPGDVPAMGGQAGGRLTETVVVTGVYDGGGRRVTGWGGDQSEGQDPLFVVKPGGTLKNVVIGSPAGDGVHCEASCTLSGVVWEDVGEDTATLMKDAPADSVMLVEGGSARGASDKVFQHNGAGTIVIRDFVATDVGVLYRSCGSGGGCGSQPHRSVEMSGVRVEGDAKAVARINPGDSATLRGVTLTGSGDLCQVGTKADPGACSVS